ncbi:hypothetical protein VP01_891g9 [Puccinia sorghi]|uniref:Uncharacterized protein n=1 Tax=Puccinia sorghi TaxID=27349 RepID=A0A0L6UA82_9BASI|nr:hypothetical protein VP01_891g9 [Puccinia sorghi]
MLTIRKHISCTVAITETSQDSRQSQTCKKLVSDYHQAQQILQENIKSS